MKRKWRTISLCLLVMIVIGGTFIVLGMNQSDKTSEDKEVTLAENQIKPPEIEKESLSEQNEEISNAFLYDGLVEKSAQSSSSHTDKLTLRSVGDVLIHDRVSNMADTTSELYQSTIAQMVAGGFNESSFQPDAEYDFLPMLAYIEPFIAYADVSVANLEVLAASPQLPVSGYPQFSAPREIIDALKHIGIDIVSNATNHTLDWFSKGAHASLSNLQAADMPYFGSYDSWEDYQRPRIIEKNGISLGFLSYSYGTNGIPVPEGEEYLINLIDIPLMVQEVEDLSQQVDAVIVSLQLGGEYDTLPNDEQFYVFQSLSDAGARLILGGHPHVLQPVDWYNDGETFAIYSQASFLSGQRELDNKQGGITEVTFVRDDDGKVQVKNPKFMPIFNLGIEAEKMYQVVPYADITLHQIPEGERYWQLISERMHHYTDNFELVTHLETNVTQEASEIIR